MAKLYEKYAPLKKADGSPTDPKAQYFVLRIDTDPAAREALATYANAIERAGDGEFAEELRAWIRAQVP